MRGAVVAVEDDGHRVASAGQLLGQVGATSFQNLVLVCVQDLDIVAQTVAFRAIFKLVALFNVQAGERELNC